MGVGTVASTYVTIFEHCTGDISRIKISALNISTVITHDGRFFWLTGLSTATALNQFDIQSLKFQTTITVSGTGRPSGIAYSNRYLYTCYSGGTLRQINTETGQIISGLASGLSLTGLSINPSDPRTGERTFWIINLSSGNIQNFTLDLTTLLNSFTAPTNAKDIHYDGRFLWVLAGASSATAYIYQYDPVTGTPVGQYTVGSYGASDNCFGLTGDGRFLYFTENIK